MNPVHKDVIVVIGAGGMGQAIARRQGPGRSVLLADVDQVTLDAAADAMRDDGYDVTAQTVDVASRDSVVRLAEAAQALGNVTQVIHTAGLSPVQASAPAILRVDLLGVALVLDEFGRVIASGGAGVVIASMAGHLLPTPLDAAQEQALAHAPAEDLLDLPCTTGETATDPGRAYTVAKRANVLRVQAAGPEWGNRGARVNSISPGIISTAMGRQELAGGIGDAMRAMVQASSAGRPGTPADIAEAAAFLLGPASSFITGTDLLVDGGVVAALRSGQQSNAAQPTAAHT